MIAIIVGLEQLLAELKKREVKSAIKDDGTVYVGFSMNYAVHVHERTDLKHKNGRGAKYLEIPYRKLLPALPAIVAEVVKSGGGLRKGLIVAGLRIQREAQQLVPILTGALRASAWTAEESKADRAAAEAASRGQKILKRGVKKPKKGGKK